MGIGAISVCSPNVIDDVWEEFPPRLADTTVAVPFVYPAPPPPPPLPEAPPPPLAPAPPLPPLP